MKYTLILSAALFMAVGQGQPAIAQSPADLVKQGVEALGGTNALRAIQDDWSPRPMPSIGSLASPIASMASRASSAIRPSPYRWTYRQGRCRVRYDWDRDMQYPAVERVKYSEITISEYGAVIDEKGQATPMSAIRIAANICAKLCAGRRC